MPKLNMTEVGFWLSEAKSCEERQTRELKNRNNYPFLINYYEGKETPEGIQEQLAIINEFFPNTNSLISEIMYQNPDIIAEAQKPEAEQGEGLMKSALIYAFDKTDALEENRLALFDMLFAGYCAVEVGHLKETGGDTPLAQNLQGRASNSKFKLFGGASTTEDAEKQLEGSIPDEKESTATNEDTYVRRYNPLSVPLDWRAERVKDRRYNLKKIWMSKAEFDVKYPDFKDKVLTSDDELDYSVHSQKRHTKKILLYEFQIKKKHDV